MEQQYEICFIHFDVESHRPKGLPCGHTICKECVMNPKLGRKCPTCRKDLPGEPDDIPDNILAIQLIENGGAPPCKRLKREDTEVQRLQRGVDAGRKLVEALRLAVPKAVEALNRQLDTSVAQLRQLEEALEQHVQRDAAGDVDVDTPAEQLAVKLEESLRLLTTNKCSVVVGENGSSWKATMQLGESDDILRLLLLQLREDGQLAKVDSTLVPSACAYVGPPMISILTINLTDLTGGDLNVNEIIRDKGRIDNIRCIRNLKGEGSDKLLRVVASHPLHVEELGFLGEVDPKVMYEVQKMSSLKRLEVKCIPECDDYPDLPLQLEELAINSPSEQQLDCVMRMPALRSLSVWNYLGENLTFPHSEYGTLRWLRVGINNYHKPTMLSLIRAHSSSLQELQVICTIDDDEEDGCFYFPYLGRELSACGLVHLREGQPAATSYKEKPALMLTRSRKKATMSALLPAPAPMKDLLDKMTLLSLPDKDLLQVLSHLHAKDLGAAGRASLRLAALTRSHPSLWKDLKGSAEFDNVEGLLSLLRVAPPVDRLEWRPPIPVEVVVITATVSVPDTKCCATVLRELGRRLEEMEISGLGRGLKAIFRSLRHATSLRSLRLRFQSYFSECDFRWPQALVLPRMHTVALDFEGQGFVGRVYDCDEDEEDEEENVIHYTETEPTLLEALRSLLLAHSQQLQHVKLQSARLLPLVDSCGSTLRQLSVEVGPWVGAELRHLRGLNRLSVFTEDGDEADATPIRRLLQTCRCPVLERLDLSLCNDQLMRDLGAGALASLQCLWVSGARASWRQESFEVALAGLPNLRSLGVLGLQGRTPGPAQMISRLSNAAIPKLGVVVFVDSVTCKSDTVTDYLGFRDLRDMVLRAPMPLHVVAVFHLWNERKRHFLFSRHSTVESVVASCTLCAEAGDIGILSEFKDIPFERIQIE